MKEDERDGEEGQLGEDEQNRALRIYANNPILFCTEVLGFTPFPYQRKMLEDPGKYIVVCSGRRVGKSLVMANKAFAYSFGHPDSTVLIVAATQRQSMLMFDKLLEVIARVPFLQECVTRKTRTLLSFTNGSRIVALPCGKTGATIRGETANLVICDETAFMPEDVIQSVLMPMLATTDGTIILLSTPWEKTHFFYKAFNSSFWNKYHFKTSDNPLVKKEFLDQQREMIGERRFRQEYLAEFVDDEDTYFPMNILRPCLHVCSITEGNQTCEYCEMNTKGTLPLGELYAGYDPGGMTDPAALVVVQKLKTAGEEGEKKPAFRVVYSRTFTSEKNKNKTGNERDVYTKFNVEISELHRKYPFRKLLLDSTGIGSPILSHCRELGLPVDGMTMHRKTKEEIFSNLRILLEEEKVELPDMIEFISSLNCIVSEPMRTGGYTFSHHSGTHDDLAYALALAVWTGGKGKTIVMMKDEEQKKSSWRTPPEMF